MRKKILIFGLVLVGLVLTSVVKDFSSGVAWYRTAALDELSGQEADIVASRWVDKVTAIIPLPKSVRESLHCQLSDRMRRRFVNE